MLFKQLTCYFNQTEGKEDNVQLIIETLPFFKVFLHTLKNYSLDIHLIFPFFDKNHMRTSTKYSIYLPPMIHQKYKRY